MKAKGNLSLEHFQSNPTWGCFERLFCPLEGLFPRWWAELSEYSPPPVGELPGRTGAYALEKDPPVSLLGVHPEVHPKHAPPHRLLAHWKCSFGLMYNWAYQLCTKKALIQLGEICTDLPPFNSGALEMWWEGVSGRQSKDEISGGWKTMKRNSPSDKSRGVGHFHLKHVPRERRALKVTDFCKHFCSDGSQWNYCFLWKERNHSSLPYKIWSVYFSKYVPPRFAANHKRSWHFMIPYYKFQKRLSSPLKELLQKQRLGAGSIIDFQPLFYSNICIEGYKFPFSWYIIISLWLSKIYSNIYSNSKYIPIFIVISCLTHSLFRNVLLNFQCFQFPGYLLLFMSNWVPLWYDNILRMISVFWNVLKVVWWPSIQLLFVV